MENLSPDRVELEENEKPVTDLDINPEEDPGQPPIDWNTTCTMDCKVNWIHA